LPVPHDEIDIRPLTEADVDAVIGVDSAAFGVDVSEEKIAGAKSRFEWDRMLGAWEGSHIVGVCGAFSFQMTVPERRAVPTAGVTWVGVLPTHRRRGILRKMMVRQLNDLRERGEPLAALWASEAAIYGRFGYGAASRSVALKIPRGADFLQEVPTDPTLRLTLMSPDESMPIAASIYAEEAARRPGMMARVAPAWQALGVFDPPSERGDATALRSVVASDDNGPRAYARYRVANAHNAEFGTGEVRVHEVFALDPAAEAAIWRFLTDLDLTAVVSVGNRPVDDPLLEQLSDPRGARPVLTDNLYVRVVDLPAALTARTLSAPLDLVIEVADPLCPWNDGLWRIEGDRAGTRCVRPPAGTPADLSMTSTDLGAIYLGGTTLRSLADAGRVHEHRDGAVSAATTAFRGELAPWNAWVF
jgi:predicted acetyltransferase